MIYTTDPKNPRNGAYDVSRVYIICRWNYVLPATEDSLGSSFGANNFSPPSQFTGSVRSQLVPRASTLTHAAPASLVPLHMQLQRNTTTAMFPNFMFAMRLTLTEQA